MHTKTPMKYKKLLYRNENREVFMITNYFYIYPYNQKILQVWQFKTCITHDFLDEYNGFRDDGKVTHFQAPLKDLEKLVEVGYCKGKRRNTSTVDRICYKFFGTHARPYNGSTLSWEDEESTLNL